MLKKLLRFIHELFMEIFGIWVRKTAVSMASQGV
jgi:hypothetical protein